VAKATAETVTNVRFLFRQMFFQDSWIGHMEYTFI